MPADLPLRDILRQSLAIRPLPGRADISIYAAHAGSRLSRLNDMFSGAVDLAPYWAHAWPGGMALVQHFAEHPEEVREKRVLDLGAGSGIVGIAAARAGASSVICSETHPVGAVAAAMNAELNGVAIEVISETITSAPPQADLIAVGDLFYEPDLAETVLQFLRLAAEGGCDVLIGDIGRAYLPHDQLVEVARYPVRDVGDGPSAPAIDGKVFRLRKG